MMREILEQPQALARTFQAERAHALDFQRVAQKRNFRLIVLVARGTSDNAALFGRYLLEITTGIPVSLAAPSIHTLYHARINFRDALVVGISQSGEATDINLVLKAARRQGAVTLGITYTGQLMLFYLLASALGPHITLSSVSEIPHHVRETLGLASEIQVLVERYRYMRQCAVVARGINYANAYELALKLMETCYVVAERFSSADFLHGPIALMERDFPVLMFMPPGKTFPDLKKLIGRLRELRADTLVITPARARLPRGTRAIRVPGSMPEIYSPIPYIVPGQIFAALLAKAKGLDPDKPRSLQIVTQTV
jgi:glucosamine--fructose-6-phosphate aminotransferase (isomerizing)